MQLDKDQILDLIREHGDSSKVDQARDELPDQVDTDEHGGVLERFGVGQDTLKEKLGGLGDLI